MTSDTSELILNLIETNLHIKKSEEVPASGSNVCYLLLFTYVFYLPQVRRFKFFNIFHMAVLRFPCLPQLQRTSNQQNLRLHVSTTIYRPRPATLLKKTLGAGVSLWILQNFEEHLRWLFLPIGGRMILILLNEVNCFR